MPWIARRYRVRGDRESTGLGGSSLGGLVTLYLGLRHAAALRKAGRDVAQRVVEPQEHSRVSERARAADMGPPPPVARCWASAKASARCSDAEMLARRLKANGWVPGETLHFERVPEGTHDEPSWARRVKPMLRFLYPR